jgi:penicillin-binding protein 1C
VPGELKGKNQVGNTLRIEDRHGRLIKLHQKEGDLSWVLLEDISPLFLDLLIKAEDKRFYHHFGVDFMASIRAFAQNILGMRRVSGASTISQQLARLAFGYQRNIAGKLLVILSALKLEMKYTKGEILEHYLNRIPYAFKVLGIGQASLFYFDKDHSKLSPAEMATLAVLIRAPSRYASKVMRTKLISLRNHLLDQVDISDKVKTIAKEEEWVFQRYRPAARSPHFIRAVLEKKSLPLTKSTIRTTLDLALQEEIQKILDGKISKLEAKGVKAASVLVIDNRDGAILSYIGNHDFFSENGEFDGVQLLRQPGSTMKPFTYALALEQGLTGASELPDIELYFKSGLGTYRPRNYTLKFTGPKNAKGVPKQFT